MLGCAVMYHLLNVCMTRCHIVHMQLKQSDLHDWMLSQADLSVASVCFAGREWQDELDSYDTCSDPGATAYVFGV